MRSGDDRMIAGVAGGLGDYFDIDPVIFRIGFGVSVFFGGLGLIAYLALALLVPSSEGGEVRPAPVQRSKWLAGAVIGAGLILVLTAGGGFLFGAPDWGFVWIAALAGVGAAIYFAAKNTDGPIGIGRILLISVLTIIAIFGLMALAVVSAWVTAEGLGIVMAGLVIAAAVGLVIAAFVGGARWLIIPALAIAIPVGTVSAAGIELEGGYGNRHYAPVSTDVMPVDGYELAAGRMVVDLREIDWERERIVNLDVDLGMGEVVVAIPEDVCLEADAHASARHDRHRRQRGRRVRRRCRRRPRLDRDAAALARRGGRGRRDPGRRRRRHHPRHRPGLRPRVRPPQQGRPRDGPRGVRGVNDRAIDRVSLAAGSPSPRSGRCCLLDQADVIEIGFGWLGAAVAAVLGVILLVSGLDDARQARTGRRRACLGAVSMTKRTHRRRPESRAASACPGPPRTASSPASSRASATATRSTRCSCGSPSSSSSSSPAASP